MALSNGIPRVCVSDLASLEFQAEVDLTF